MRETALRPGATTKQAFNGTAASVSITVGGTYRIQADSACWVDLTGTATTSSMPVTAGVYEYIRCVAGDSLSVIDDGTGGNLYVTFCKED